jgi:hypothetical protein
LKVKLLHIQGVVFTESIKEKREAYLAYYTVSFLEKLRGQEMDIWFVYDGQIYDQIRKGPDLVFVVGDLTTGLIGEEGIFLPARGEWYPQLADSMGHLWTFILGTRIAEP